ncbi:hypothetical protein [Pseudoalteromonas rubra]|nr:hypothetical protein [Pseudoalteromonas rubra]
MAGLSDVGSIAAVIRVGDPFCYDVFFLGEAYLSRLMDTVAMWNKIECVCLNLQPGWVSDRGER